MRAIQHSSNNHVLGAPAGWDQFTIACAPIPLTRSEEAGIPLVSTFWTFTPEERIAIAHGANIQVTVPGHSVQPMRMNTVTTI